MRLNLNDGQTPHLDCSQHWISASGNPVFAWVSLPNQCENIAIRKWGDVVVLALCGGGDEVTPSQVAFPIKPLNDASSSAGRKVHVVGSACADQAAVGEEVGHHARVVFACPRVDFLSAVVDQVSFSIGRDRHQGVAVVGLFTLGEDADRVGLSKGSCACQTQGQKACREQLQGFHGPLKVRHSSLGGLFSWVEAQGVSSGVTAKADISARCSDAPCRLQKVPT